MSPTITRIALLLVASGLAHRAAAQAADSTGRPAERAAASRADVAGAVSVTNNGIAVIPSFTLGRPAAIFDVHVRGERLSFEPQFRFGLDGKPWTFLFWGRCRLPERGRLRTTVGAHPALNFRPTTVVTNGAPREVLVARRYMAGELSPSYALSRHVGVGGHYLYSHGVDRDAVRHTHFVAARASLTDVRLPGRYVVRADPQLYYLRTGGEDGVYLNAAATVARRGLPVSVSAMANTPIRTRIAAGQVALWNVSLTYAIR